MEIGDRVESYEFDSFEHSSTEREIEPEFLKFMNSNVDDVKEGESDDWAVEIEQPKQSAILPNTAEYPPWISHYMVEQEHQQRAATTTTTEKVNIVIGSTYFCFVFINHFIFSGSSEANVWPS